MKREYKNGAYPDFFRNEPETGAPKAQRFMPTMRDTSQRWKRPAPCFIKGVYKLWALQFSLFQVSQCDVIELRILYYSPWPIMAEKAPIVSPLFCYYERRVIFLGRESWVIWGHFWAEEDFEVIVYSDIAYGDTVGRWCGGIHYLRLQWRIGRVHRVAQCVHVCSGLLHAQLFPSCRKGEKARAYHAVALRQCPHWPRNYPSHSYNHLSV